AQLEASGEGGEGVAVDLGGNAESFEHFAGAGLQGIAVVAEDEVLQVGVAVGVEFLVGVGEEALLLDHGLPDVVVAHHGHFEDGHVLETEVNLLEDAQLEALGHRDGAFAGDVIPGEHFEERRLARAIGPHEAIAVAGIELNRDPLEQRLGAEGFAKVGYGDHRAGNDSRGGGRSLEGKPPSESPNVLPCEDPHHPGPLLPASPPPAGRRGSGLSKSKDKNSLGCSPLSPGRWGGGWERGGWGSEGPPRRGALWCRDEATPLRPYGGGVLSCGLSSLSLPPNTLRTRPPKRRRGFTWGSSTAGRRSSPAASAASPDCGDAPGSPPAAICWVSRKLWWRLHSSVGT